MCSLWFNSNSVDSPVESYPEYEQRVHEAYRKLFDGFLEHEIPDSEQHEKAA